jgi:benzoyl-CoA reductase/2-hydroxyglutaryl-CoA dehydratase subunit BcrC/BadD/HgdB
MRLFIEGSDIDNTEFYEIVESCGAIIAGENSSWGNSYPNDPVDDSADPLEAIAERYHLRPSRYRTQSLEERAAFCLLGTRKAKAKGTIFFIYEGDPAPTWDVPNQKKELDKNNIPTINLSAQKYFLNEINKPAIKTSVEKFIGVLRKGKL